MFAEGILGGEGCGVLSDSPAVSGMCVSHEVAVTGTTGDSWAMRPLEDSPVGDVWELRTVDLHGRLGKLVTVYCQT